MNFADHIATEHTHLRAMAAVPGFHAFVLDKAKRMERNPMYAGCAQVTEEAIGPDALPAARKALEWFAKYPAQEASAW